MKTFKEYHKSKDKKDDPTTRTNRGDDEKKSRERPKLFRLRENHPWVEFNYRFGEDPKVTKRKAEKLRKKFNIPIHMPGDY